MSNEHLSIVSMTNDLVQANHLLDYLFPIQDSSGNKSKSYVVVAGEINTFSNS